MLEPRYKKYAQRIEELISEADKLLSKKVHSSYGVGYKIPDEEQCFSWKVKVENIIKIVFKENSPQILNYNEVLKHQHITSATPINRIKGILIGALDDLNNGFLKGQEFLIAAEVFENVLEQAKHLNKNNYKDPAAVLCRVVLEDSLRRIAKEEGLNDSQKASKLNDELKSKGRINQLQWRQNQVWLDIGNSAAHGKFEEYDKNKVESMIEGIMSFLANEFD